MEEDIDPQLVAEIESAQPCFIVFEGQEDAAFELAHAFIEALALEYIHNLLCVECRTNGGTVDRMKDSETLLTMIRMWLKYKYIPHVLLWYPSTVLNKVIQVRLTAAP